MIPKYVEDLLIRRRNIALKLSQICEQIDAYCDKIGINEVEPDSCIHGHVSIYCEPEEAYNATRAVIENKLNRRTNT